MGTPEQAGRLLLDERLVIIQPTLVRRLGSMRDAVVLQQIHYRMLSRDAWEDTEGNTWTAVRYTDLAAETGLSADQVRRGTEALEKAGVVQSCQPEHFNRRKSYRVDYDHPIVAPAAEQEPQDRSGTSAPSEVAPAQAVPLLKVEEPSASGGSGETTEDAKPARKRNPIFDALAEVFPAETRSEGARVGKVAAELAALRPPPKPEIIVRVAKWIRAEWPKASVMAVSANWTQAYNASRPNAQGGNGSEVLESCRRCGQLPVDCVCDPLP